MKKQGKYRGGGCCFQCKKRASDFACSDLEAPPRFELGHKSVADFCLTTWLWCRLVQKTHTSVFCKWSGRRDSNSRRSPWQGDALPLSHSRIYWCLRVESNRRHRDFQSLALPTELQRQIVTKKIWRPGWGSNPRPLA